RGSRQHVSPYPLPLSRRAAYKPRTSAGHPAAPVPSAAPPPARRIHLPVLRTRLRDPTPLSRRRSSNSCGALAPLCGSPAAPPRAANLSHKLSVSFWAVPFNRRAPTLATVPRTSELALHFRRDRLGGMSSISSMVLTSTPEPGALPRADILRLVGGFTSDSSTSR